MSKATGNEGTGYVSPRDLAFRWRCSRTSAQRIAKRAGLCRYCLGEGRNGMVRYALEEVEAYEASRCVSRKGDAGQA